jgi:DNA modification methylase
MRGVMRFEPGEQLIETQKPVKLLGYLIETYTNSGATVLDPTAGVFSTGLACRNTGRRFVGIEKLDKHFRIGIDRLHRRSKGTVNESIAAAD